jgi:hypothetical protein
MGNQNESLHIHSLSSVNVTVALREVPQVRVCEFAGGVPPRVDEYVTTYTCNGLKAMLIECGAVRMRLGKPSREHASPVLPAKHVTEAEHRRYMSHPLFRGNKFADMKRLAVELENDQALEAAHQELKIYGRRFAVAPIQVRGIAVNSNREAA